VYPPPPPPSLPWGPSLTMIAKFRGADRSARNGDTKRRGGNADDPLMGGARRDLSSLNLLGSACIQCSAFFLLRCLDGFTSLIVRRNVGNVQNHDLCVSLVAPHPVPAPLVTSL
jgi:hypothetical protein